MAISLVFIINNYYNPTALRSSSKSPNYRDYFHLQIMYQSKKESNRHKGQSMQVLAALGVLCFTQSNYGSALQSKHTSGQVSGMTTSSEAYLGEGLGVSSSMMTSEMNRIAADVEDMVQENSELNTDLVNKLVAGERQTQSESLDSSAKTSKKKRHHRRHHKHKKHHQEDDAQAQKNGDRPSDGKTVGLRESKTMEQEEQEATQRTMDMVREELEHSIDDDGDDKEGAPRRRGRNQRPVDLSHFSKQSAMMAAQNGEEDRDLDDPDFSSRKGQEAEKHEEQEQEPGQAAAEKILKAQQVAAQREREEERMEEEAQARAHQMMMHQTSALSSSIGSASSLAHQLSSTIEDKPYEPPAASSLSPMAAPAPRKTLMAPVQTEKTANLIAQAIMHQQQQAAGVEEESPEPQSAFTPASSAESLASAARETRMAATQTKDAAPMMPLGSQVQQMSPSSLAAGGFSAPVVTKDELIEGSKIALSAQDAAAKDRAVKETLARLKGAKPSPLASATPMPSTSAPAPFLSAPPSPLSSFGSTAASPLISSTPSPFLAPPSQGLKEGEKEKAVSRTLELIKNRHQGAQKEATQQTPPLPSLPTPFLPGPSPQAAPVQSTPIQKAQKPRKQAKSADDDAAEPEKPEKKLSQKEEEEAEFDYMNDVEARQRKLVEKHQKAKQHDDDGSDDESKGKPQEKHSTPAPELAEQKPKAPVVEPQTPKPAPASAPVSSAQSDVVRATLERIKKNSQQQDQVAPTPLLAPAPSTDKDTAVAKTLQAIRQTQQDQQKQNLAPTPFVDPPPAAETKSSPASSPEIEAQRQKVEALQEQVKQEDEMKKEEAQRAMVQKAIDAVKATKQQQQAPAAPKQTVTTNMASTPSPFVNPPSPFVSAPTPAPFIAPQAASQAPVKKPTVAQPVKKAAPKAAPKTAPAPAPAPAAAATQKAKQEEGDEVAGYKIAVDKLDFDEPGMKHDQPGGNPAEREKQEMAEKEAKSKEQNKQLGVQSMKQKKNDDGSTSYTIETSGLDADDDNSDNQKTPHSSLTERSKKQTSSNNQQQLVTKKDDGKLKQIKKDDGNDFKIETTVATADMIKHLVGDNTPDEEEEPAPLVAAKAKPAPAQPNLVKPVAAKSVQVQKAKPVLKAKTQAITKPITKNLQNKLIKTPPQIVKKNPQNMLLKSQPSKIIQPIKPVLKPANSAIEKSNDIFSEGIAGAIAELEKASKDDPVPFAPYQQPIQNQVSTPMFTIAPKEVTPSKIDLAKDFKLPQEFMAKNTIDKSKPVEKKQESPAKKDESPAKKDVSKPMDMRAQIQSIVASIQPALQKAIGSSNTAKIQIIINDKDEDQKKADKKFQNELNNALNEAQKSATATKNNKSTVNPPQNNVQKSNNATKSGVESKQVVVKSGSNQTLAVNNITISAQSQSQVQQIVDAVKNHPQQANTNVTVVMDPTKAGKTNIVDTASQYIDAQNKLNSQTAALKAKKEEQDEVARLAAAVAQIEQQMDQEQKKKEDITKNAVQHARQVAKEKEERERKAHEQYEQQQAAALQQQMLEQQRKRDEIVQKQISLAKQQKQAQAQTVVQRTLQLAKQAQDKQKQAQQEALKQQAAAAAATPYQKAIESSLQKAKLLQKPSRTGGALSNLAASLESTIVEDQPAPFVSRPAAPVKATPVFAAPAGPAASAIPEDNSLRSQIIRSAIAKGKEQELQKAHPLSGGLFDSVSGVQATVGSPAPSATVMPASFQAPYLMVQKANSTAALVASSKEAVQSTAKNATQATSKNTTKVAATNSASNSTAATKTKSNQTAPSVLKVNQTTTAVKNLTATAVKSNQTVPAVKNATSIAAKPEPKMANQTVKTAVKQESNKTVKATQQLPQNPKDVKASQNQTASAKTNTTVSKPSPKPVPAKKPQANQTLAERRHSSSHVDERELRMKQDAANEQSVDDLVKQADSNRAEWAKKKTEEIRAEEEQRATSHANEQLKEENEALRQRAKDLESAVEQHKKEAEKHRESARMAKEEADKKKVDHEAEKKKAEHEAQEREESEKKRREESERKSHEETERKQREEHEQKEKKEKEEERMVAEKAREQVKKDFEEKKQQEEKRRFEESQKRFEQSHKEAEAKRRKEEEEEDRRSATLKLHDDFAKGESKGYKKYEKKADDHGDSKQYRALKTIASLTSGVREEMGRQEHIREAATKAYLKGLANDSPSKSESRSSQSKFEMMPSEKAKQDKKQKRKEDQARQSTAEKSAIGVVAHQEALKDKLLRGSLVQQSQGQAANKTSDKLEPKQSVNVSKTAQVAQQSTNTSHVQVKSEAEKDHGKDAKKENKAVETAAKPVSKNESQKAEANKAQKAPTAHESAKKPETKPQESKPESQKLAQQQAQTNKSAASTATKRTETKKPTQALSRKLKQQDANGPSSDGNSAPISHTFAEHQQEMNIGEASSESVTQMPTTTSDVLKARSKQSLAALQSKEQANERQQGRQQGGLASQVQTQVLNMANAESKGTSINQHRAAVMSTSSLMLDDLKMLDKELSKESKPSQPTAPASPAKADSKKQESQSSKPEAPKPTEPKREDKSGEPKKDEAESWFAASVNKFRNLKKRMFSALSLLPQTASDGGDAPDNFDNIQMTNQQKLGLFDAIVNEEDTRL